MKAPGQAGLVVLGALAAWGLGACGDLAEGGFGEATILVASEELAGQEPSADAASVPGAVDALPSTHRLPQTRQTRSDALEGTLDVRLQVYLRNANGFWTEATAGERRVTLPLSGGAVEEIISQRMREGLYPQVRIVFNAVEAEVTDGLILDGDTVTGTIRVPTEPVIGIERPLNLFVDENVPAEVLIELHPADWLVSTSPASREVTPQEFESRVTVSARNRR